MFDGFFPQTLHDFLYNKRLLGFLLLIPVTREIKLLQTIGTHVVDQLHSPLRPIRSQPVPYQGNPFQLFFTYLTFKNYPEKLDRWRENLIDRNESQVTTLHATLDPFVGTLTTTNMASNFLYSACAKIQNMAFKTSKMDQIALEY